jgi:AraC-like DNA-binding protein/mannose-6-phosphate isomerase-like protein (cupin superfamily)
MKEYRIEQEQAIITKTGIEFFLQEMPNEAGRVNPHIHSALELLFVKSGSFRMFADDEEFYADEGCAVLFRSNTVHRVFPLSEGKSYYYVLKIKPSLLADFSLSENTSAYLLPLALTSKHQKTLWTASETEKNGIARGIDSMARDSEKKEYGFDIAMKSCAADILLSILRDIGENEKRDMPADDIIRRIYDVTVYINRHYAENITAADCAARAFMSPSYFSRCFYSITQKSFKDYLNTVRINHAEKELFATDKPVTRIASDCGFSNLSYFISVYKKAKGITPKQAKRT